MTGKRQRCWMLEAMFHQMAPSAARPTNKERRKQARRLMDGE